jgi:hypothetical protein
MGDKSLAFVEKTHDYASDNPTLVPSYLDMGDFERILATPTGCGGSSRPYGSLRKPSRTRSW